MNCRKKYIWINFLFIHLFITNVSFAQKPVFGLKLGLAVSHSAIDENSTDPNSGSGINGVGIIGGVYLDIPLANEVVFRPGAEIVSKGKNRINGYFYYPARFTYVDIPLNVFFKDNSSHGHLIAGGGPALGIPFRPTYGYALKTDIGLNGIIGYEFPVGFSFNVNYCYGLNNISKNQDAAKKISTRYLGITAGYSF